MTVKLPEYIEDPIKEKLHKVMVAVIETLPEEPDEAFVSTSFNEGALNYLGIWLFTPKLLVEIRNPLSQDRIQYEIARLKEAVDWIRLNARKYEFKDPREDSQLDLEFTNRDGFSSALSATGQGCQDLLKIYRDIFLLNFTGLLAEQASPP